MLLRHACPSEVCACPNGDVPALQDMQRHASKSNTCRAKRMSLRKMASELARNGVDERNRRRANVSREVCVNVPANRQIECCLPLKLGNVH